VTGSGKSMINAMRNKPCIWDTSLKLGEDEKELVHKHTFYPECFIFLFHVINRLRLTTPAAAAIIAEHSIKPYSTSPTILKRGQFLIFRSGQSRD
jgi:hypothetical protein